MKKLSLLIAPLLAVGATTIIASDLQTDTPAPPAAAGGAFIVVEGGVLDICVSNSSSNYTVYDTPLLVDAEHPLAVYTSRYTEFNSPVKGNGVLSMYCGGERTFIGDQKGNAYPNWIPFTGEVHVYPWRQVEPNAGWYGIILNHGGKTFNPENIAESLQKTNTQLQNNKLYIHDGATLATPTGTRGVRIGELNTDAGSRIYGAIKKSTSSTASASYLVVGYSGTDAVLAGEIRSCDDAGTPVGIIKEGAGTYRITGNDNLISGSVRVLEGAVMIDNDAQAAAASRQGGAIGALKTGNAGVYVFEGATVGGNGHSASTIDLYGTLNPGDGGTGTLTLADYVSNRGVSLRLRPTSKLQFDVGSAKAYDRVTATGDVELYNIDQHFGTSDNTPIVYIMPTADNDIQVGDEYVLISAAAKSGIAGNDWTFRIQYPKQYTWQVDEVEDETGYRLVATALSMDYTGQGDVDVESGGTPDDPWAEDDDDGFDETTDPTPLRVYADKLSRPIGVALSTWRISGFDNDNTPEIKTISTQFNAVVAENEMKFDATEPSRGSFSYGAGDRIVRLAQRHGMYVRGHALAWHKQMPTWLSSDGGVKNNNNFSREELLSILKNHIDNVVGHYKGKIGEWDVVNECLSDDQTAIRNNPSAYDLRPSVWMTGIGEDYIDSAFVYAHRADPDARLILNEYGVEFKGVAKTEALFNLAKRLVDSGIPIHGVGLQCHLDCGEVDASKLAATISMYEQIGLDCIITELDLGIDNTSEASLQQQQRDYRAIARVAYTHPNCRGMIVWGFSDDQSWRSSSPLLYNSAHQPKPAYYGVHAVLRRAAGNLGITMPGATDATVVAEEYYDVQGHRLAAPTRGITIRVRRYSDGTVRADKLARH